MEKYNKWAIVTNNKISEVIICESEEFINANKPNGSDVFNVGLYCDETGNHEPSSGWEKVDGVFVNPNIITETDPEPTEE
jgi:hypothetical protein